MTDERPDAEDMDTYAEREPDPRWAMANDRTALAWVRTSLAFVAGGVGLTSVARAVDLSRGLDVVAGVVCVTGAVVAATGVVGWRRRDWAMRHGRPLPRSQAIVVLGATVVLVAVGLAVYLLAAVR